MCIENQGFDCDELNVNLHPKLEQEKTTRSADVTVFLYSWNLAFRRNLNNFGIGEFASPSVKAGGACLFP